MILKGTALFFYLFMGFIFSSILIFVFVSILSIVDFWIVKNITGRFLVGLRWWRKLDENGNEDWEFEYNQ